MKTKVSEKGQCNIMFLNIENLQLEYSLCLKTKKNVWVINYNYIMGEANIIMFLFCCEMK